jgi:hypothetical protein
MGVAFDVETVVFLVCIYFYCPPIVLFQSYSDNSTVRL